MYCKKEALSRRAGGIRPGRSKKLGRPKGPVWFFAETQGLSHRPQDVRSVTFSFFVRRATPRPSGTGLAHLRAKQHTCSYSAFYAAIINDNPKKCKKNKSGNDRHFRSYRGHGSLALRFCHASLRALARCSRRLSASGCHASPVRNAVLSPCDCAKTRRGLCPLYVFASLRALARCSRRLSASYFCWLMAWSKWSLICLVNSSAAL